MVKKVKVKNKVSHVTNIFCRYFFIGIRFMLLFKDVQTGTMWDAGIKPYTTSAVTKVAFLGTFPAVLSYAKKISCVSNIRLSLFRCRL